MTTGIATGASTSPSTDTLSATFAALADPTRRAMLARLAAGPATVGELAAPHEMSLPSVSRHLKVLERVGLVTKGRSAQWRPCRLEPAPLRAIDEWVATYRDLVESRIDCLELHAVGGAEAGPPGPVPPGGVVRS